MLKYILFASSIIDSSRGLDLICVFRLFDFVYGTGTLSMCTGT
jgi:hypothetical protein